MEKIIACVAVNEMAIYDMEGTCFASVFWFIKILKCQCTLRNIDKKGITSMNATKWKQKYSIKTLQAYSSNYHE